MNSSTSPLFFDLETVPDYSRLATFDLPPVPPPPAETPADKLPQFGDVLGGSIDAAKAALAKIVPPAAWCDQLEAAERAGKQRAGIFALIAAARNVRQEAIDAAAARCKLLSTTPEFCRIAAFGWAEGDGEVRSVVDGDTHAGADESDIIDHFWTMVGNGRPIVGFNVLGFDLPVILIRSALLGIMPTRTLSLSPHSNRDVIDLYLGRFGAKGNAGGANGKPGRLKSLAALMGIDVPAEGVDGSQVADLMQTDPGRVGEYVRSDVTITREYYRKLRGYFWI